ncbi:MAG TPA: NlpC/P60 family protein [Ilumatobacter sp.]|nr:NlpC/P60 family protein [Ilumatobacter sp.]
MQSPESYIRATNRLARLAVLVVTFVFVTPMVSPQVVLATVEDQRAEVERIVDELDRLHEQADILAEDYAEAVDQQNQLGVEIVDAEARVADKEAELTELRGDLTAVAVQAFTGAGSDVLGPLFSNAEAYSDDLRGQQYSSVALDVGTGTTDDLDELISELDAAKRDLEDKRKQVEALTVTIADKQQQTEDLTAQYTERRVAEEARLGVLIQQEEERRAAAAYAALQAQYAASQQQQASSGGGTSSSGGNSSSSGGGGNSGTNAVTGSDTSNAGSGTAAAPVNNTPVSSAPSPSGRVGVAIAAGQGQLGVPYRYATSNPGESFDCSGLTHYAWAQAGVSLPRNSRAQASMLPSVPPSEAQPGDLLFYYSPISHVGIYLGGGSILHAPATGDVVKISSVSWNKVTYVGRPG